MKSHQQSPRSHSRRSSPRKFQRSGPFKSLRGMSSGMFSDDRRTLRKPPTTRSARPDSTTKDILKPKPKARKGLSQILGWKQGHGPSDAPPLPPLPPFAADLAPLTRPRPSAGPDPFRQVEGGATRLPAGSSRARKTSATARAMTAERHAASVSDKAQVAGSRPESSWVHSLAEYDVPLTGSTSDQPLSAEELPNRFSSLRDAILPRSPRASNGRSPRSAPAGRQSLDKEKTSSRIWKAISTRSRKSTVKSQLGADDKAPRDNASKPSSLRRPSPRDNASKPSSLRRPSPRHVPTIRVTRPSTGTAGCATPAAVRRRQKSQASSKSSKSETRNRSPRVKPDAAASRRLPKRKSLAGLFGVALKRSSDMLRMAPSTPLVTPQHSPKALRRLADTIDGAGHHLIAASAGQQPMSMSDTSPDTAAFFSRVGGRGIDNPRIIRSQRSFDDATAATGHLDRLVQAIGHLSPSRRRQSASPESKGTWSSSWKQNSLLSSRAKSPAASPSSGRFRTPLSLAPRIQSGGAATDVSPSLHNKVRDFMPTPPRSPMNRLRNVRQARLSIVHEQEERLRPSSSTFRSRPLTAPSTASSSIKPRSHPNQSGRDGSILISVGAGSPGPDARSLEVPVAPYDVADSPSASASRASILLSRSDDRGRATLYPRAAATIRHRPMRPASTSFSAGDRDSFDFTTELAGLESGTDRISFMQALEQSRNLDSMFGLTTAIDQRHKVTKCSPSIVKTSKSDFALPQLVPLQPKEATTYRRKPKSSTAPFAGQPGFSLPRPTVTWAPPQLPLPPLPPAPRAERPQHAAHHQKQPSAFSFMSLSSLGEPIEGIYREGHMSFERNFEGISDTPRLDLGSKESLADLQNLLNQADRSLQRESSTRLRQTSTSTTDSHLLDPQTILSMLQSASRQTSAQSMSDRLHQNSSSTLASVNDAEISVVTGPPIDMRKRRQASVYSIRGSKDSSATIVPSPTRGTRARIPSDASSVFSYSRIERPTLGDRMFDRDDDCMLEAMSPVSPEAVLGFRSFQEQERRHREEFGDTHPYSIEYGSRAQRGQTSSVTIDLGMAYGARKRDQRVQSSSSTFDFGHYQNSQRGSSNSSCRASDSSDQTIRLSMSLPRVFHSRAGSVSSCDEPYGGALDHYLDESPMTTISDRFTAALNAQGKGPTRTSILRPKPRSITRRHRPPRLQLSTDNESLPDLISPGDTSTEVSSLFSLETRNSIPPSGVHPQGRVSSTNVDVQPTIREEPSYGTIRTGNPLHPLDGSHSPRGLGPLDWQPNSVEKGVPAFLPSSYHDIQLFLAQSQEAYRPLEQVLPSRGLQHKSFGTNRPAVAPYDRGDLPPPETRYRNMRSSSDAGTDLPASALLAHFARDSEVLPSSLRFLERKKSPSPVEDSSFRSSVTDSTRRRNLGWRRKRHSEDITASSVRGRSPLGSVSESMIKRLDVAGSPRDRKPSVASVASPLPTFIAFTPPAPPKHGSFPSRRVMVDANGSPFAGWEDGPTEPLRVRSRDFSPLKHVSGRRDLSKGGHDRERQPLGSLWSHGNSAPKSKIPQPAAKDHGNQQKPRGRSKSKPKTPKIIPLKHEPLPTRRRVFADKENAMPRAPVARTVPRLM